MIYGENRPVVWQNNASSLLFSDFSEDLKHSMAAEGLALHAHTFSVSIDTYMRYAGLRDEMLIT